MFDKNNNNNYVITNDLKLLMVDRYLEGKNGYPKDEDKALSILFELSRDGLDMANYYLYELYKEKNKINQAIYWLKKCYEKNVPGVKADIYLAYSDKQIDWISEKEAFKLLKQSAEEGDELGMIVYANQLLSQDDSENNLQIAKNYYRKAAKSGNCIGQYKMYKFLKDDDREIALSYLKKSAGEQDYVYAQYALWQELSSEAFFWLKKAYENEVEHLEAKLEYAQLLEIGVLLKKDYITATNIYKELTLKDYDEAAYKLNNSCYFYKYNDEYESFVNELIKAEAFHSLAVLCSKQLLEGEAVERNIAYINMAVEKDIPFASVLLSHFYKVAGYIKGCESYQNTEKYFEYLKKAADIGDAVSQKRVFLEYYKGNKFSLSQPQALEYLHSAIDNGSTSALNLLGILYYKGIYVQKDENTAFDYFMKAAENGEGLAYYNLGILSEKNHNLGETMEYFKKGAELNDPNCIKKVIKFYKANKLDKYSVVLPEMREKLIDIIVDEEYEYYVLR